MSSLENPQDKCFPGVIPTGAFVLINNPLSVVTVMRLMKQPYITYATAATMGQLKLESGVNLFCTPATFPI